MDPTARPSNPPPPPPVPLVRLPSITAPRRMTSQSSLPSLATTSSAASVSSMDATSLPTTHLPRTSKKRKMSMRDVLAHASSTTSRSLHHHHPHAAPIHHRPSSLPRRHRFDNLSIPQDNSHDIDETGGHSEPLRHASSIARLKNGKDVCVVAHHGVVDWLQTYYLYGFDKNSLFYTLVPLRPDTDEWSFEESAYLFDLVRWIQLGKMRLPRGKPVDAYVAEKLHTSETRVQRRLEAMDGYRDINLPPYKPMTRDESDQFKQVKRQFLETLEDAVVAALDQHQIDQSAVLSIKY
ncbi:Aste57867_11147 [Aphanomyces stellatus]|uniref:Aste57867_11147 protein n=1 Tax=Aphanomyces stellatus TaxID=120398 RepID=A0A485KTD6_9STRA|nr:hypothetical protein As57867_011105 [Aphanomyces stellatus]VFT88014.1 Aste57867_11147 [Aphanomyces stellatus]